MGMQSLVTLVAPASNWHKCHHYRWLCCAAARHQHLFSYIMRHRQKAEWTVPVATAFWLCKQTLVTVTAWTIITIVHVGIWSCGRFSAQYLETTREEAPRGKWSLGCSFVWFTRAWFIFHPFLLIEELYRTTSQILIREEVSHTEASILILTTISWIDWDAYLTGTFSYTRDYGFTISSL